MLCTHARSGGTHGQVRTRRTEDSRVGNAAAQEGIVEERTLGTNGEEPQAGHRHRSQRGARKRAKGPVAQTQSEARSQQPLALEQEPFEQQQVAQQGELVVAARRNGRAHSSRARNGDARSARARNGAHHRNNHSRSRFVRYAVVGLGHIAQVAVLPAFAHAKRNSRLTALVSDDATKLKALSKKYGITHTYDYDAFDECLRHVDAVYIALPNSMHKAYTMRAANAGVHVLCEKPMAVTVDECREMIDTCRANRVKLMIAYRLHFEQLNLKAIDLVRQGRIGSPKFFNSSFAMRVRPDNIRTKKKLGGGTLYDIGVYCINAARYLFRAEPTEVMAISVNGGHPGLREIDESTGAVLRFDGERVAAFVTSFNASDVASYRIVGTKGQLHVDPAYEYAEGLSYELTVDGKTTRQRTGKHDQFAPELLYFSDCILRDREPEPSGEEGLQDVRIIQALYESAETGKVISIPPMKMAKRPSGRQRITRPPVSPPSLVKVRSASKN
jgi:glucose-fructose oxidoreductase